MLLASVFAVVAVFALPSVCVAAAVSSPGEGAGQTHEPKGLAVDRSVGSPPESGRLYVADKGSNRVDVFGTGGSFEFAFGWKVKASEPKEELQTCTTASGCQKGSAGAGAGQLGGPISVAVDNDETSTSFHDVYVVDFANRRIEKFKPNGEFLGAFGTGEFGSSTTMLVAVGPGGKVSVADTRSVAGVRTIRLRRYEPTGGAPVFEGDVATGELTGLAVDSSGDAYIRGFPPEESLCKYDSTGAAIFCFPPNEAEGVLALATDGADHLFAVGLDRAVGPVQRTYRVIAEYDPTGNPLRRFGYGELEGFLEGLAVHPGATGPVYASGGEVVLGLSYPTGPLIAPEACAAPAATLHSTRATLVAEVNPEGKATHYHFEYVNDAAFQGSGFATATRLPLNAGQDPELDANPKLHLASQEATNLAPETKYHCRVVAKDSEGHEATGQAGEFTTRPPLEIKASWATEVGVDTAKLNGEVNPLGSPSTGYFEYVDDAGFKEHGFAGAARLPDVDGGAEPLDFGAGEEPVVRGAILSPLPAGTTYHYRLVAENAFKTLTGPEHTFTTFAREEPSPCPANEAFRGGLTGPLPDCRAYELVSPLEKNNADVIAPLEGTTGLSGAIEQSSSSGEKLAYSSIRAFANPQSSPYTPQYIASRDAGAGEWRTHSIDPPRERPLLPAAAQRDTEFKAFSPDLCQAWQRTVAESPLAEGAIAGSTNLYRRTDEECGGPAYTALTTIAPPGGDLSNLLELQGISADGSEAIYVTKDTLAGTGAPGALQGKRQLYVQSAEGTRFACLKPGGAPSVTGCTAGTFNGSSAENRQASLQGAISLDGSRIFWSEAEEGPGPIYLRENPFAKGSECSSPSARCTVAVSATGEALTGGGNRAQFWGAARDGSRAIFSVGSDLYEFEPEGEATHLIAHKSPGVAGMSEDATHVYFASEEVLSGANVEGKAPAAGKANLYLHRSGAGGGYAFVAILAAKDVAQTSDVRSPLNKEPSNHTARTTPDGEQLAFMSYGSPTGYDNTDAVSGEADAEAYLYDASASGGAGGLVCASCNPGGGRPVGFNLANKLHAVANNTWVAGQIPVWENTLYASRALSEDGKRLFFESTDALTPRDTNGAQDVYQWEAPGEGSCTEADPTFAESNGGCVSLISSGTSPRASELRDASPSGDDVFIGTLASLVSWDYGLVDIYDARVDGGLPEPPSLKAGCEGETCQASPTPPPPPSLGSAIFQPADLPEELKKRKCPKGKRKADRDDTPGGGKAGDSKARGGRAKCEKRHRGPRHHRLYPRRWRRGGGG